VLPVGRTAGAVSDLLEGIRLDQPTPNRLTEELPTELKSLVDPGVAQRLSEGVREFD